VIIWVSFDFILVFHLIPYRHFFLVDLTMHALETKDGLPQSPPCNSTHAVNPLYAQERLVSPTSPSTSAHRLRRPSIRSEQEEKLFTPRLPVHSSNVKTSHTGQFINVDNHISPISDLEDGVFPPIHDDDFIGGKDNVKRALTDPIPIPQSPALSSKILHSDDLRSQDVIEASSSSFQVRVPVSAPVHTSSMARSLDNMSPAPIRSFAERRDKRRIRTSRPNSAVFDDVVIGSHGSSSAFGRNSGNFDWSTAAAGEGASPATLEHDHLRMLIDGYEVSEVAKLIRREIDAAATAAASNDIPANYTHATMDNTDGAGARLFSTSQNRSMSSLGESLGAASGLDALRRRFRNGISGGFGDSNSSFDKMRATPWTQFQILSGRTFKNLYRNPNLLVTHYLISVVVSVMCGLLFWKVNSDIGGFQNRMGLFFFICALFGFGCLSSMQAFASERLIFMRERANRYYHPITYFVSKVCGLIDYQPPHPKCAFFVRSCLI
jgi:hypothetical protein